jgi:hypothetical protein
MSVFVKPAKDEPQQPRITVANAKGILSLLLAFAPVERANQPELLVRTGPVVAHVLEIFMPPFCVNPILVGSSAPVQVGEPLPAAQHFSIESLDVGFGQSDVANPDGNRTLGDPQSFADFLNCEDEAS